MAGHPGSVKRANRPVWVVQYTPDRDPSDRLRLRAGGPEHRPWTHSERGLEVVFDGLLYNRKELSRRLSLEFDEDEDPARCVLSSYARWGADFVHKLEGVYALVINDTESGQLLLARDRVGVYPLFYSGTPGGLLVSTSIQSLADHPGVSRSLNRAALAGYLLCSCPNREETLFTGIKRLPAGHLRIETGNRIQVRRYWRPPAPGVDCDWLGEDDIGEFDSLLDRVLQDQLAAGPAGLFLSGGLDSVSIAAVAAHLTRASGLPAPLALSLGFPGPVCDEENTQRRVAGVLRNPLEFVPFGEAAGPRGLIHEALEVSKSWPLPIENPWTPAYLCLGRRAAEAGRQTILTGRGGDEWLTVGPRYAATLIENLRFPELFQFIGSQYRSYRLPLPALVRNLVWINGLRPIFSAAVSRGLKSWAPAALHRHRLAQRMGRQPDWLAPDPALRTQLRERADRHIADNLVRSAPADHYLCLMLESLDSYFVTKELEDTYEFGRRLDVHVLEPYWDSRLLELLYRTPPKILNRGGRSKGLVRESVARRFPDLGFEKQRKVLAADFFASNIWEQAPAAWRDSKAAKTLAELGVIDSARVEALLEETVRKRSVRGAGVLWEILNLNAWASGQS